MFTFRGYVSKVALVGNIADVEVVFEETGAAAPDMLIHFAGATQAKQGVSLKSGRNIRPGCRLAGSAEIVNVGATALNSKGEQKLTADGQPMHHLEAKLVKATLEDPQPPVEDSTDAIA